MKNFKSSIEFEYLYRDAGNYKLFEQIIFSNPECLDLTTIEQRIRGKLIDSEFFHPSNWGIKKPRFPSYNDELDHDLCEFFQVKYSNERATSDKTISAFLESI